MNVGWAHIFRSQSHTKRPLRTRMNSSNTPWHPCRCGACRGAANWEGAGGSTRKPASHVVFLVQKGTCSSIRGSTSCCAHCWIGLDGKGCWPSCSCSAGWKDLPTLPVITRWQRSTSRSGAGGAARLTRIVARHTPLFRYGRG